MPGSGTSVFTDPDDYQTSLRWAQMELLPTPGKFKARLTWAELHCLRLMRAEERLPRIAYVTLTPALIFVAFPTATDAPPVWGGVNVEAGNIMFHSRGERLHQWTRGPCLWSLIALPPKDLEDYGRALSGKPLFAPTAGRVLRPRPRDTARLRRLHIQACRLAETKPKTLAHPEVARAIEQGLIQALVTCLSRSSAPDDTAPRRHHSIMIRFEEVVAENVNRPPRVSEICKLIGITERTLRSCCTEFVGISPARYLVLWRLKQVRTALRNADPATATAAEVARLHGFTELARFAAEYQRAFGETPSATLASAGDSGFLNTNFSDFA
jgi:AraC-like DNA-binding protein